MTGKTGSQSASCWHRLEFGCYSLIVTHGLYALAKHALHISNLFAAGGKHAGELPGLQPGWLFGRMRDDSDIQWREFRNSLPLLTAAFAAITTISRLIARYHPQWRRAWLFVVSTAVLFVFHGSRALFMMALTTANYIIAHRFARSRFAAAAAWAFHIVALFCVQRYGAELSFARLHASMTSLDAWPGMLRWHIVYNLLMLRMLSFAIDLHRAARDKHMADHALHKHAQAGFVEHSNNDKQPVPPQNVCVRDTGVVAAKQRIQQSLPLHEYGYISYHVYLFYAPLYFAGPTMTFNDFAHQLLQPLSVTLGDVVLYAARLLFAVFCLELGSHAFYVKAILRFKTWTLLLSDVELAQHGVLSAFTAAALGFWALLLTWLKFLVIWRFTRCCALADGTVAPENMKRCMFSNYDVAGFWRHWHASFNAWLVRYVYVPLGGARWRLLNVWPTFMFVAAWHDVEPQLLLWAALMCVFIAPEVCVKWIGQQPSMAPLRSRAVLWRLLCGCCATLYIALLMVGNAVGFVVGVDGAAALLHAFARSPSFAAAAFVSIFANVQIVFAIQDWQQRAPCKISTAKCW